MDIEKIITLLVNNTSAVTLLIYFIYKDNKFSDMITKSLSSINESLEIIRNILLNDKQKGGD